MEGATSELLTHPEHMSSLPVVDRIRAAQFLSFCVCLFVLFYWTLFCISFDLLLFYYSFGSQTFLFSKAKKLCIVLFCKIFSCSCVVSNGVEWLSNFLLSYITINKIDPKWTRNTKTSCFLYVQLVQKRHRFVVWSG